MRRRSSAAVLLIGCVPLIGCAPAPVGNCAACAAVANELERQVSQPPLNESHEDLQKKDHRISWHACSHFLRVVIAQMREEWSHLQLTVRDRKRKLAAEAVQAHACNEAIITILGGICDAVKEYAHGVSAGGQEYYQKVTNAGSKSDGVIVISGAVRIGGSRKERDGLSSYCRELMGSHEDQLARIMTAGTDDLITDLCIHTAGECTEAAVARMPPEGLPHRQRQQ
jgi:hypothetical protein